MRSAQVNFSRGEIAPELQARWDVDAYASALRQARNVIVLKYGGVTKRPGTQLVAEVFDASKPVRLVPFQFSLDQSYAVEMGQGYARIAAQGGLVLQAELAISGISSAAQAVLTVAYHGYAIGDQVYLTGIAGALGERLNKRMWKVLAVGDAHHFTIDADTSGLAPFSAAEGGTTNTAPPPPPPPPPPVPQPTPAPTPPTTGGGGSGNFGRGRLGDVALA